MTSLAYIIDFTEPGQVADAYLHYLSKRNFPLATDTELALNAQVRVRFNFPDGHGITLMARVIARLSNDSYNLQLPDNASTDWLLDRAREMAERVGRVRGKRRKTSPEEKAVPPQKTAAPKVEPTPAPEPKAEPAAERDPDTVTRRIEPPAAGKGGAEGAPGPSTRPIRQKGSGEVPPPQVAQAQEKAAQEASETRKEPSPPLPMVDVVADAAIPSEEELRRRVAELDELVRTSGLPPGTAPPTPIGSMPVAREELLEDTRDLPADPSLDERIAKLSANQKKKLAISGGPEERAVLLREKDTSFHIWVLMYPVLTYDERRTTVTADNILMQQKMNAQERRKVIDKVAAAVLLQAWLDGENIADVVSDD